MSDQIIREGMWASERLRRCSRDAHMAFPFLFPIADHWGRWEYDVVAIWAKTLGFRGDTPVSWLQMVLDELEGAGLFRRYEVRGKHYAAWLNFRGIPMNRRNTQSRFPAPEWDNSFSEADLKLPSRTLARRISRPGPKVRFEVLKRDGFKCRYCGKLAAEAELVVDHVQAIAEGGTNDLPNLATSCVECNTGKGHVSLPQAELPLPSEHSAVPSETLDENGAQEGVRDREREGVGEGDRKGKRRGNGSGSAALKGGDGRDLSRISEYLSKRGVDLNGLAREFLASKPDPDALLPSWKDWHLSHGLPEEIDWPLVNRAVFYALRESQEGANSTPSGPPSMPAPMTDEQHAARMAELRRQAEAIKG